ncbi:hypothetical protein Mapa_012442 [Marchantia paleacea]|nr:hypothetical protein Mapa_012442 [Marchantia paleacea]
MTTDSKTRACDVPPHTHSLGCREVIDGEMMRSIHCFRQVAAGSLGRRRSSSSSSHTTIRGHRRPFVIYSCSLQVHPFCPSVQCPSYAKLLSAMRWTLILSSNCIVSC